MCGQAESIKCVVSNCISKMGTHIHVISKLIAYSDLVKTSLKQSTHTCMPPIALLKTLLFCWRNDDINRLDVLAIQVQGNFITFIYSMTFLVNCPINYITCSSCCPHPHLWLRVVTCDYAIYRNKTGCSHLQLA